MIKDEKWPVARLIPISSASGVEAQERRAASALLAVISAVSEFGKALLKPLGAPAGRIETFIEIPFKTPGGKSIRPDGIITVSRGGKTWGAIVETKVGSVQLDSQQIDAYLDLARELDFNAVLSISNQYVTSSTAYPIDIDRRKAKRVALHHWSWVDVLTEAVVQKQHRGVSDPDQAYILGELIRYLSDPRSGAMAFENMGGSWTTVKDGARQQTLRKSDTAVTDVAARWDDLVRYLGLELTKDLGRDVKQVLIKEERTPTARQNALKDSVASTGRLYAELHIPDAAGTLEILADLRSRQVSASTRVDAPREGRTKGRVSWLLRQLQNSDDRLKVEVRGSRGVSLAATLGDARQDTAILYPEANKEVRAFSVTLTRNMGLKRDASKGSFIESVISTAKDFYADVLQNLRPWKASPPKLKKAPDAKEVTEEVPSLPEEVKEGIQQAEAEMSEGSPSSEST